MNNIAKEPHLDIYTNRFELHHGTHVETFHQGPQSQEAKTRYKKIVNALKNNYLDNLYSTLSEETLSGLSSSNKQLIDRLVNGITSEIGRGLLALAFLQLTIKSICPDQNVRLHKGGTRKKGTFSWVEGISMRSIDSKYTNSFLRKNSLLKLNKHGLFMTRTLAENYPYSKLYKADIRGPVAEWGAVVDAIETKQIPAKEALCYMMSLLQNRSERFQELSSIACGLADNLRGKSFDEIKDIIFNFFNETGYSARAFEVSIHSFFQALSELDLLNGMDLVPLSQMRSANKKHKNIGDIELEEDDLIIISWDAKYGKPYLREELDELRDKLISHSEVKLAGFVSNTNLDKRRDIIEKMQEIELETGVEIQLLTFDELIDHELASVNSETKDNIAHRWLKALVETFAQKRTKIAPIDEPCENWINDLIGILEKHS